MADITYTVNQDDPNSIDGFEQFSQADKNLIGTFEVNNLFDSTKNLAELHILSLTDTLLESHYDYSNYKLLANAQSAGKSGASILSIDPIEDSKLYGYQYGGVKLLYHFLNDLYTDKKERIPFYIESISPDRTEVRLQSLDLTNDDVKSYTQAIKDKLSNQSYFNEFRLNFDNNDLFIGINIDVVESDGNSYVAVKLYEPLPTTYDLKSITYVNEVVSDSVAFEVDSLIAPEIATAQSLRSPNFNLEITDYSVVPTGYYSYNDLFSYPVNNANSQIFSLYNEKGAEISIDHTDYVNFVHFSSAYERLINFKYKLQLIENYSSSLAQINTAISQSAGTTGSSTYYSNQIQGVLNNFDHYERFLYYESSSTAWPKSNTTQPYTNVNSSNATAINWYANQLATANGYDLSNGNLLTNTIPSFLRDDPANENYLTFIHMIGQHFDNLWIYGKAVTDKYDADNRLDFGISKDLVGEALKNFGVKLYTSNKSIEDLFGSFIGQPYQSGSEIINNYVTGSVTGSNTPTQPIAYDNYNKEVQKRIYHNLSHLVKTKGTERGLRALINCFGIPSDILKIKLYGGRNVDERPFYGDFEYYTSSLDKIRLDNTGSLVTGSTLSQYTSIYKRDPKYTDDLHAIEVGFSPTDNIDNYIVSYSLATSSLSNFNIDNYIGDPRSLTADTYGLLNTSGSVVYSLSDLTNQIMSGSTAYDVFDYVRLIKFFDNTIFKMVRDFIPARVTADTGIIIKPHILQRNKAKSPLLSGSRTELSASIDTAFIQGSHGSIFDSGSGEWSTRYIDTVQTPIGIASPDFLHNQEQAKYNGELSGSGIVVTNGNLSANNPYLVSVDASYDFGTIQYVSSSNLICLLQPTNQIQYITSSTQLFTPGEFFNIGSVASGQYSYSASNGIVSPVYSAITFPYTFNSYSTYTDLYLVAIKEGAAQPCTQSIQLRFGTCSLNTTTNVTPFVREYNPPADPQTYNIRTWFTSHPNQTGLQYTASFTSGGVDYVLGITDPTQYPFTQPNGTQVTITIKDPNLGEICKTSYTTTVGALGIGVATPIRPWGHEFSYSRHRRGATTGTGQTYFCEDSEGTVGIDACTTDRLYRFLGIPKEDNLAYAQLAGIKTFGIPGFFTDLSIQPTPVFPTYSPPGGPDIRYRVYQVRGLGILPPSSPGAPYKVELLGDYSPYAIIQSPIEWLVFDNQPTFNNYQMVNYVTRDQKTPAYSPPPDTTYNVGQAILYLQLSSGELPPVFDYRYPAASGLLSGTWPVTLYTDFNTTQTFTGVGVSPRPESELVRAYIIQAYNPSITPNVQYNDILQQAVVYGSKEDLAPIEGAADPNSAVVSYQIQYLKVDHDYTISIPTEQGSVTSEPDPNLIGPNDIWVKFPRRIFT